MLTPYTGTILRARPAKLQLMENYCGQCEWTASTNNHTRAELSRAAINYAVETGHNIESMGAELSPSAE
jgi:hypothetical protein